VKSGIEEEGRKIKERDSEALPISDPLGEMNE